MVEMWHGRHASAPRLYRSAILDSTVVVTGVPRVFDLTSVSLVTMPELTVYVTNEDSTAAYYDIDLMLIKGQEGKP